jgi:beta-glucosidase
VGCSGVGDFELALGGTTRFAGPIDLTPGAEPIDAMMRPPQRVVRVWLRRARSCRSPCATASPPPPPAGVAAQRGAPPRQ